MTEALTEARICEIYQQMDQVFTAFSTRVSERFGQLIDTAYASMLEMDRGHKHDQAELRNHVMRVNAGNRRRQKRSNPDTHRV